MRVRIVYAALLGCASVMMGAAGSHVVAVTDAASQRAHDNWMLAVEFGLLHALAAVASDQMSTRIRLAGAASWAFIGGSVLFCGSIWLKTLAAEGIAAQAAQAVGPAAPLGGLTLISAWAVLAAGAAMSRPQLDAS